MKRVTLLKLSLINFRGHKDLSIDFGEKTEIAGDNKKGKSTVFDAFVWLLFGKDQFDRKDYEITPIIEGNKLNRLDSEVCATIDTGRESLTLKRVLHPKWVRRRGTSEEVFDGYETLYWVNDVPKKAGEYKSIIDAIIDETVFKLITHASAFLALNWQKQREFLFQIAGTASDHEIASSDPRFAELLEMLNGKKLKDIKDELRATKKRLNDELERINPRIDQTSRLMPANRDFEMIEKQLKIVNDQIREVDDQIADRSKSIRSQYEDIQAKQGEINSLKTKQREILNNATNQAHQDAFAANQQRNELSNQFTTATRKLDSAINEVDESKRSLAILHQKAENKSKELEQLREDWVKENAKEYTAQAGCLICPIFKTECGDPAAKGKHSEAQQAAETAFFEAKERKLNQINQEGANKKDELQSMEGRIKDAEKYLKEAEQKLATAQSEHEALKLKIVEMPIAQPKQVVASELQEWNELEKSINEIHESISNVKAVETADLQEKKKELNATRDDLLKNLADRDLILKHESEIQKLQDEAKKLAQQIADIENTEFTINDFNKLKIEECDRRINGLFKIVRFQLFDKTLDGNEFETCIPTNKAGVPISVTNSAERINAGLDIINTLSGFYNVSAPIFCDNSESVNEYINAGSQMVFLKVTKDKELTISTK